MAKKKITITVDPDTVDRASRLVGGASTSGLIDRALRELIRVETVRRDIVAYRAQPPDEIEALIGATPVDHHDLTDDTHWDALYGGDDQP
jgi:hypothetical protein